VAPYVADLRHVVDMEAIAGAGLRIGADPLGGSSVDYWDPIADRYGLALDVVNRTVDPAFAFMSVDHDGKIRMDCSSPYAMAGLIGLKDRYDIAFGTDPDGDRHGIVTPSAGLMNPNHVLSAAVAYLFSGQAGWKATAGVGKTLVSTSMIDRVAADLGRPLAEMPVGFKWFVPGLLAGSCGFGGEESAGAAFLRRDGTVWTTDKDGILMNLLACEMTAKTGLDPACVYRGLEERFGRSFYNRIDSPATHAQKAALLGLSPEQVRIAELAGEPVLASLNGRLGTAPRSAASRSVAANGWFAIRPSGTEEICKLYAESFLGEAHLRRIEAEAEAAMDTFFRAENC